MSGVYLIGDYLSEIASGRVKLRIKLRCKSTQSVSLHCHFSGRRGLTVRTAHVTENTGEVGDYNSIELMLRAFETRRTYYPAFRQFGSVDTIAKSLADQKYSAVRGHYVDFGRNIPFGQIFLFSALHTHGKNLPRFIGQPNGGFEHNYARPTTTKNTLKPRISPALCS